jgi:hypothetical protein
VKTRFADEALAHVVTDDNEYFANLAAAEVHGS